MVDSISALIAKIKKNIEEVNALMGYYAAFPKQESMVRNQLKSIFQERAKGSPEAMAYSEMLLEETVDFYMLAAESGIKSYTYDTMQETVGAFLMELGLTESYFEMLIGYLMVLSLGSTSVEQKLDKTTIRRFLTIGGIKEEQHSAMIAGLMIIQAFLLIEVLEGFQTS